MMIFQTMMYCCSLKLLILRLNCFDQDDPELVQEILEKIIDPPSEESKLFYSSFFRKL